MPEVRLCASPGCGQYRTKGAWCERHYELRKAEGFRKLKSLPRDRFYASPGWKITRRVVWERDGYLCQNRVEKWMNGQKIVMPCLKDVSGKGQAVAHHLDGWDGPDPYNPDRCITVCRECSGKLDGGRATSARAKESEMYSEDSGIDSSARHRSIIPPFC